MDKSESFCHRILSKERYLAKTGTFPKLAGLLLMLLVLPSGNLSAFGPAVWQDHATGLAIGGYDPVAYFTKSKPQPGHESVELIWGGAIWRFISTGNRAAFKLHPHVYAPGFAGYDAYALANGRTTAGVPLIWAHHGNRIYLFHNAANRKLWSEQPDVIIGKAKTNWKTLSLFLPSTQGF